MFPGSEFSARTVLPWNLRAQGPRRAQRLRKDADEQRDTQSGRRAALAAREARGLRVHLSQIVRKVASEARECTSEVARPRVLTPHRLLEGGTATKSAGGQASPVQSPSSRTHCFAPFLQGPPGFFPACPARARARTGTPAAGAGLQVARTRPQRLPASVVVAREEARMRSSGWGQGRAWRPRAWGTSTARGKGRALPGAQVRQLSVVSALRPCTPEVWRVHACGFKVGHGARRRPLAVRGTLWGDAGPMSSVVASFGGCWSGVSAWASGVPSVCRSGGLRPGVWGPGSPVGPGSRWPAVWGFAFGSLGSQEARGLGVPVTLGSGFSARAFGVPGGPRVWGPGDPQFGGLRSGILGPGRLAGRGSALRNLGSQAPRGSGVRFWCGGWSAERSDRRSRCDSAGARGEWSTGAPCRGLLGGNR